MNTGSKQFQVGIILLVSVGLLATPATGEPFTRQREWTGEFVGDQFGFSVADVGDIDGDGRSEIAVGANVNDALIRSGGRAYMFSGGSAYPDTSVLQFSGDLEREYAGGAVAGGGDLNNDGVNDWVVGAPGPGIDGLNPGRVLVFYGGTTPDMLADAELVGAVPGGQFGAAVCLIPDFDGDGIADLAVGSPRAGNGQVAIYLGAAGGLATTPSVVIHGRALDLRFGKSLAVLPDRNGDARSELLVGVPRSSESATWAGAVLLYDGSAALDTIPDLKLLGESAGDEFGYSVCAGGDFNTDGIADILVGAPFANLGFLVDCGRSYAFSGGAILDTIPDLILSGTTAGERFGTSVALGFDWDDDGNADMAVGAPDRSGLGVYAGAVDVFYGGALPDTLADITIDDAVAEMHLGTTVAVSGNLLGNGDASLCIGGYNAANEGVVWLYGRDADPLSSTPHRVHAARLLAPPWPSPANPRVQFALRVDRQSRWEVGVYDIAGRRVTTLHDGLLPGGRSVLHWDGRDRGGRAVASGVYFVQARSGALTDSRRFVLTR